MLTPSTIRLTVSLVLIAPMVAWLGQHFMGLQLVLSSWKAAVWAFALAPLLEEYVFRALLQRGLEQQLPGAWHTKHVGHVANGLVAVAFVAAHYPEHGGQAVAWLVPAWALGELWRRSHQLGLCVLMHSWFNLSLAGLS